MSTLWIDYRQGSCEFEPLLRQRGIDAKIVPAPGLDSADFAFEGRGPDGALQIGIERKTLTDLTTSLRDGRLCGMPTEEGKGGQLHRLLKAYDVVWLLVEGHWVTDNAGRLQVKGRVRNTKLPGAFTEDSLTKQLLTLELKGQLRIAHTSGMTQSAAWLASTFRWWTDKDWNQHGTMNVVHTRQKGIMPLSTFREMTMPLPGIGLAGSKALEHAFGGSLTRLLHCAESTLADIEIQTPAGPRRLGARAKELREALNKLQ